MKKLTLLSFFVCAFFLGTQLNAQTVFVLQNGPRAMFYNTIDDVKNNMQNGDTLYLPGKTINGNLAVNTEVTIIGAGYHPDSTKATGITKFAGHIYFDKKSKGSSITGVHVEGHVYVRDSLITITRCSVQDLLIQDHVNSPISQTYAGDCVIRGRLLGSDINNSVTNSLVERCIIHGNIAGGDKSNNLMIKNCMMLYNGSDFCGGTSNLLIQSSIIVGAGNYPFYNAASATLKNNLWVRASFTNSSFTFENNVFGVPAEDIFVDLANGDYRIKPSCAQALTLAIDGKQVGIYGTDHPFLVPTYAPRILSVKNAESVVDGKVAVDMTVEARDR